MNLQASPLLESASSSASTAQRPRGSGAGERLALLFFSGPALLWFVIFMIGPLVSMFYLATLDWNSLVSEPAAAGLANFERLLSDPVFRAAIGNTALYLLVAVPMMIPLAFLLGFFLSRRPLGYRLLSIIFFTPALVSASARAMIFLGVYLPDGIINDFLRTIGQDAATRPWLADNATALWSVVAVEIWSGIGFTGVILAARLSGVQEDLYEAARLDGASTWTVIWRIAYPVTRDFVGVMTMLQFLWLLLGSAQNVLLLTHGGPGSASMTLSFYLYNQAFEAGRVGYSQAIGVVLFVVGLAGMLVIRRAFRTSA
jgi:ABC-type sugar transport system permease subunit